MTCPASIRNGNKKTPNSLKGNLPSRRSGLQVLKSLAPHTEDGTVTKFLLSRSCSEVVEQGHESKVHVELLVAMKKRESGIIRGEADFHFLVSADHHDILHYPC